MRSCELTREERVVTFEAADFEHGITSWLASFPLVSVTQFLIQLFFHLFF